MESAFGNHVLILLKLLVVNDLSRSRALLPKALRDILFLHLNGGVLWFMENRHSRNSLPLVNFLTHPWPIVNTSTCFTLSFRKTEAQAFKVDPVVNTSSTSIYLFFVSAATLGSIEKAFLRLR